MADVWKHWLFVLLLGAMAVAVSPARAEPTIPLTADEKAWIQAHKIIRTGVDPAYPPFEYIDYKGVYSGMASDYLKLIGKRLGVTFKIIPGLTWTQVAEGIKDRTVDVSPVMTPTEARQKFINFTQVYLHFPQVIVTQKDYPPIDGIQDLDGKTVAASKGYSEVDDIRQFYPTIKLHLVDNPLEGLKAVATGKADATQGSLAVFIYLIDKHNLINLHIAAPSELPGGELAMGVRKDWGALTRILDKALDSITEPEHREIRNKWVAAAKVEPPTPAIKLTKTEKTWIKEHKTVRVMVGTWPPFQFMEGGNPKGLAIDYVRTALESLGLVFEPVPIKWHDALAGITADDKTIDLLPTIARSPEREKMVSFTKDYLSFPRVIFTQKEGGFSSLKDLHGKTVALEKNFITQKLLAKDHPEIELMEVSTTLEAMEAVSFGKADAYVGNLAVGIYLIEKKGLSNLKVSARTDYKFDIQAIGVRKDWPELAIMIDKALAAIPEKQKRDLQAKYLSIEGLETAKGSGEAPTGSLSLVLQIGGGALALIIMLLIMSVVVKALDAREGGAIYESKTVKGLGMVLVGLFLTIVVLSAWFAVEKTERQSRDEIGENLRTVLQSNHEALKIWVKGKYKDINSVADTFSARLLIRNLLTVPRNSNDLLKSRELLQVRDMFKMERENLAYIGFFIITPEGISIASMRDKNVGLTNLIHTQNRARLDRVFKGETVLIPPIVSDVALKDLTGLVKDQTASMFVAAPIHDLAKKKVIAAATLRIDPVKDFSRILQLGRVGKSGETYAFNRAGLMISESRFNSQLRSLGLIGEKQKSILNIHIRDPGVNLLHSATAPTDIKELPLTVMAAKATAGGSGLDTEGYRDYRGVPVMGAWLWDKDLGLGMTTEIDVDEALQSFFSIRNTVLIVLGVTVLMALILTGLSIWIGQSANRSLRKARDELEIKVEERTQDLRDSEERTTAILNSAADGVIVIDEYGVVESMNPAAENIFGYSADEVIGQNVRMLMPKSFEVEHDSKLARYREFGDARIVGTNRELVGLRKDGTEFPMDLAIGEAQVGGGRVFAGVMRDITQRKQDEEELRAAKNDAESATQAKASFLATMSHEIRTPMNGIIGMVDMLVQTKLEDDQRQMMRTVRDSAYALLTIINDILDFSKIEAGKLDLENIPLSIRDAVEGVCETLAPNANKKGIKINIHVDPEIPDAVLGDQVRIRQVLFNIAGNAVKFTEDGKVLVRALLVPSKAKKKATVRFEVIDFGIGISKEAQADLFKEFSQAESSTTRRFGGTGLGLSICQRLVEMMKGKIEVESELGEGSKFIVTLTFPIADKHEIKSDGHDLSGLKILFVGDDAEERELDANYLRHWKAEVTTTGDFESVKSLALEAVAGKKPFDIITLGSAWPLETRADEIVAMQVDKALSGTRFALMTETRTKAERKDVKNTVYIESDPLRRASFIRGIAIAAGRASPEVEYEEEVIDQSKIKVPTIEEAEAAGTLILVAEDNPTNRDVIGRQLKLLGHTAEFQNDGKQALQAWQSKTFALLLTDCHMPEMDGFELTQAIRKTEKDGGQRLPIIAITASILQAEIDRCYESGMDDFLAKPLEMPKLKAALKKWMPSHASSGGTKPAPESGSEPDAPISKETDSGDSGDGPIDPKALKSVFGDDEDTFKEILQEFVEPATNNIGEIEAAFSERSADGVAKAAHKLKSSARSVGAVELADLCLALETAGKADDWDEIEKAAPLLAGVMDSVAKYIESL